MPLELVLVPKGEFLMGNAGSDADISVAEQPQHRVYVSDFYIGRYPITNAQYAKYARATSQPFMPPEEKDQHPVVDVTWEAALEFCKWATRVSVAVLPPEWILRLPTEAEWEKAARGCDGRVYPWGNEWEHGRANTYGVSRPDTTPVGMYSPQGDSPYGAADMCGNVWEWCLDWYDEKKYRRRQKIVARDPCNANARGPSGERVVRGGAHDRRHSMGRCTFRNHFDPGLKHWSIGFRVVASPLKGVS
jgi:formylglycine-generating enzyme required for sulfatase activity